MDTALPQKFPFTLDRNLAKANCTGNLVLGLFPYKIMCKNLKGLSKYNAQF